MKTILLVVVAVVWCAAFSTPVRAAQSFVFKVAAVIPVNMVVAGPPMTGLPDKVVTKSLKGNDLINLALGRPLTTKVDAKAEVLALQVFVEGPGMVAAPQTQLIVFNPNPDPGITDAARIKAVVATLADLNFDLGDLVKKLTGQGIGTANIVPTTTGVDVPHNQFMASSLTGSGQATVPAPTTAGEIDGFSFAVKSLTGTMHFLFSDKKNTGTEFNGVVAKGLIKTSGKPIRSLNI